MKGHPERMAAVVAAASQGLVTANQLSRKLKVSPRTVYRYVARLKAAGIRIQGQAGAGYILRPERKERGRG